MRKLQFGALAFVLALTTACIHKTGGTAVTPWERVDTYNAALASSNNSVERGAEAVVSSGLANPLQVAPIITATGRVAALHLQVTAILQQGAATQANVASAQALVDQIKMSISVIPMGSLGIKNPKTQQSFSVDLNSLGTLADEILTSLQAVQK